MEVAPNAVPPVCKIMDYGKHRYEQSRKQGKTAQQKRKEIRVSPVTGLHDLEVKIAQARKFLAFLPGPLDAALRQLDAGQVTSFMLGYCRLLGA